MLRCITEITPDQLIVVFSNSKEYGWWLQSYIYESICFSELLKLIMASITNMVFKLWASALIHFWRKIHLH